LTIIHGDAQGADTLAKYWARHNHVPDVPFPADWTRYGLAAGPIRNQQMIDQGRPNVVIAFVTGSGPGTRNMLRKADEAHIETIRIEDT
jgi:hypothetical protein